MNYFDRSFTSWLALGELPESMMEAKENSKSSLVENLKGDLPKPFLDAAATKGIGQQQGTVDHRSKSMQRGPKLGVSNLNPDKLRRKHSPPSAFNLDFPPMSALVHRLPGSRLNDSPLGVAFCDDESVDGDDSDVFFTPPAQVRYSKNDLEPQMPNQFLMQSEIDDSDSLNNSFSSRHDDDLEDASCTSISSAIVPLVPVNSRKSTSKCVSVHDSFSVDGQNDPTSTEWIPRRDTGSQNLQADLLLESQDEARPSLDDDESDYYSCNSEEDEDEISGDRDGTIEISSENAPTEGLVSSSSSRQAVASNVNHLPNAHSSSTTIVELKPFLGRVTGQAIKLRSLADDWLTRPSANVFTRLARTVPSGWSPSCCDPVQKDAVERNPEVNLETNHLSSHSPALDACSPSSAAEYDAYAHKIVESLLTDLAARSALQTNIETQQNVFPGTSALVMLNDFWKSSSADSTIESEFRIRVEKKLAAELAQLCRQPDTRQLSSYNRKVLLYFRKEQLRIYQLRMSRVLAEQRRLLDGDASISKDLERTGENSLVDDIEDILDAEKSSATVAAAEPSLFDNSVDSDTEVSYLDSQSGQIADNSPGSTQGRGSLLDSSKNLDDLESSLVENSPSSPPVNKTLEIPVVFSSPLTSTSPNHHHSPGRSGNSLVGRSPAGTSESFAFVSTRRGRNNRYRHASPDDIAGISSVIPSPSTEGLNAQDPAASALDIFSVDLAESEGPLSDIRPPPGSRLDLSYDSDISAALSFEQSSEFDVILGGGEGDDMSGSILLDSACVDDIVESFRPDQLSSCEVSSPGNSWSALNSADSPALATRKQEFANSAAIVMASSVETLNDTTTTTDILEHSEPSPLRGSALTNRSPSPLRLPRDRVSVGGRRRRSRDHSSSGPEENAGVELCPSHNVSSEALMRMSESEPIARGLPQPIDAAVSFAVADSSFGASSPRPQQRAVATLTPQPSAGIGLPAPNLSSSPLEHAILVIAHRMAPAAETAVPLRLATLADADLVDPAFRNLALEFVNSALQHAFPQLSGGNSSSHVPRLIVDEVSFNASAAGERCPKLIGRAAIVQLVLRQLNSRASSSSALQQVRPNEDAVQYDARVATTRLMREQEGSWMSRWRAILSNAERMCELMSDELAPQ